MRGQLNVIDKTTLAEVTVVRSDGNGRAQATVITGYNLATVVTIRR